MYWHIYLTELFIFVMFLIFLGALWLVDKIEGLKTLRSKVIAVGIASVFLSSLGFGLLSVFFWNSDLPQTSRDLGTNVSMWAFIGFLLNGAWLVAKNKSPKPKEEPESDDQEE